MSDKTNISLTGCKEKESEIHQAPPVLDIGVDRETQINIATIV